MSISGLYMHTHTHKHMDAYTTRTQKYTDEKQKCELQVSDNFLQKRFKSINAPGYKINIEKIVTQDSY